ncbi:dehydrogenase/reductase SDR family protein 7-like [Corticium candelabrum]|uniref:dehydrogenase/reductase SDR family protein 7-like n=1 Tax=Corticium candelabrum TaxID=121492 RepID=UPI002E27549E|nr:dehydrogenase/reductase SDR family protein 7-like [Corticium candelabrum]
MTVGHRSLIDQLVFMTDHKFAVIGHSYMIVGEALARMMSEQGARLIISSRNKEELEDIQKSMNNGHNVKFVYISVYMVLVLDLSNIPNAPELVRQALDMYGHIDVLVNNAGIFCRVPVEEVTDDLLRKIMEVDFFGQVALTQAVLPDMLERRCGQIVNVLSVLGKFGYLLRAPYSAAKFALNGYMSTLRLEMTSKGISVCNIMPGPVITNVSKNSLLADGKSIWKDRQTYCNRNEGEEVCRADHQGNGI